MRVDVSEVKTFRECPRKWSYSSRNFWHLRATALNTNFIFGTLFHEALHALYLGGDLEKTVASTLRELSDPSEIRTMEAMIRGYAREVLPGDLQKYKPLDVEHKFELSIEPFKKLDITLCGSIDMIALNLQENRIDGFEHKTCRSFRDPMYSMVDEQPRLYTFALRQFVEEYNAKHNTDYAVGVIYLNEVRKVQRAFDYNRTVCKYTDDDLQGFLRAFFMTCEAIERASQGTRLKEPLPGMMKCSMCEYKEMCLAYQYASPTEEEVLDEFGDEFVVRENDHLDEKVERKT